MIKKIFIACCLILPISLHGQVDEQLTPQQRKQKTVVTEPQTLYKGFFRGGMAFSYATIDKIFNADAKRQPLPTNIWASTWFLQAFMLYGISDRLQVELRLPYAVNKIYQSYLIELGGASTVDVIRWNASGTGLSDMSVGLAYQILTEQEQRPSFTSFITAKLPTGEKNPKDIINEREFTRAVGSGELSLDVRMQVRRIVYPFSYTVSSSYTYFFGGKKILNPMDVLERPFRSGNNLNVDGTISFHLNDWLAVQNTLTYFFSGKDEMDGELDEDTSWVFQYYPALSFQVKRFRINQIILVPLAGKLSSADPSYIVGLSYVF